MAAKTTISDAQLKQELFLLFEKGNTGKTNVYEQLRTRFNIMKQRVVNAYPLVLSEWQKIKE